MILDLRRMVARHPASTVSVAVLAVALIVFVLVWFQPQQAFLDTKVDEALPSPAATQSATTGATSAPAGLVTLASGDFHGLEHATAGRALVVELPDGRRVLRFEGLDTLNGPDLHVYLSQVPAGDDARAYGDGYVDLGKLKGNKGNQNYSIPTDLALTGYRSVVIWCKRFAVGFGVAPLER